MADDSPGKVKALRAIFAEKNTPVMGIHPSEKITNKAWNATNEAISFKERVLNDQNVTAKLITKVLPVPAKQTEPTIANGKVKGEQMRSLNNAPKKPFIGPKPPHLSYQNRTSSPTNSEICDNVPRSNNCTSSDGQNLLKSQAKSKAVAETIATFMFTNGASHKNSDLKQKNMLNKQHLSNSSCNITAQAQANHREDTVINSFTNQDKNNLPKLDPGALCSSLISSDNYICKGVCSFRKKSLPSFETLGPPPAKPSRPPHLKLPGKCPVESSSPSSDQSSQSSLNILALKRPAPQKPSYPCPARPQTPPPLPPADTNLLQSLQKELEELYEDTILSSANKRPVSLIPEFTAEEELYNDAAGSESSEPSLSLSPLPRKPKDRPPPLPPSEYLQPRRINSSDDLYQDTDDLDDDEFYEVMPCEAGSEELGSPLYSNNKKEIERLRREDEKKSRKEQKEKEKREREMDKLKKKFGLTGEEIPIDDGLVKSDSRGNRNGDLPVKRGETVLILRMEGNPSGRWLAKNEKGKIGYVELTNIEVDPDSVKSVMAIRRLSVISFSEELYSEAKSEEEAIYETTY